MAEVSTRVASLLAQPHRLEINVRHQPEPLIYFPDVELGVDKAFVTELKNGCRLSAVAGKLASDTVHSSRCLRLVLEVKMPDDPRLNDSDYEQKIRLAGKIYSKLGIHFMVIEASNHFSKQEVARFRQISLDRHTGLDFRDFDLLRQFSRLFGRECSYGDLVETLGGGPSGRAKVAAFQVRRYLSIDLEREISDATRIVIGR
ncbi:hypothetical protein ELH99_19435 [Rhizobium leguminosarum]|nr:hypothetical protein ELH99_19435 [Rhizobium leguminosarum]